MKFTNWQILIGLLMTLLAVADMPPGEDSLITPTGSFIRHHSGGFGSPGKLPLQVCEGTHIQLHGSEYYGVCNSALCSRCGICASSDWCFLVFRSHVVAKHLMQGAGPWDTKRETCN